MRGMANYQQKWHFEKHRSTYPETEIVLGHEVVKGWHIVFPRTNSHIQGVKNGRNEQQYARSHVRPKRRKRELFEKHQRHFALLIILDEEEVKQSYRKERKRGKIPFQRTEIKFLAECNFSICPVRASKNGDVTTSMGTLDKSFSKRWGRGAAGRLINRKWFQRLASKAMYFSASYLRRV